MCCSGTVGGEWRMTEKVRERREVLFRDCGWGVEDEGMCCSGTVGGEWRMTEKVRERRDVLFRDCGWGVEDDRESEGEKGCVVQGLWVGSGG